MVCHLQAPGTLAVALALSVTTRVDEASTRSPLVEASSRLNSGNGRVRFCTPRRGKTAIALTRERSARGRAPGRAFWAQLLARTILRPVDRYGRATTTQAVPRRLPPGRRRDLHTRHDRSFPNRG